MAKLDHSGLFEFAAATTAVTLTTSRKLLRNFRYYKETSSSENRIYRDELVRLCRGMRQNAFGLHNLLMRDPDEKSPFLVSLAGEIYDQLEELHRKLLFFDADRIDNIIPVVDSQRRFWKQLTETDFYSESLLRELEGNIPKALRNFEEKILSLPVHTPT